MAFDVIVPAAAAVIVPAGVVELSTRKKSGRPHSTRAKVTKYSLVLKFGRLICSRLEWPIPLEPSVRKFNDEGFFRVQVAWGNGEHYGKIRVSQGVEALWRVRWSQVRQCHSILISDLPANVFHCEIEKMSCRHQLIGKSPAGVPGFIDVDLPEDFYRG